MKLRKSLACLLILAFVFANLPTGMAMVNAENAGSTGSSASVFARTVTTQSDSGFTSPVYFFQQGYTDRINTDLVTNFSVTDGALVAPNGVYASVQFKSGSENWRVASKGQLKFDVKAGSSGNILFRIIQEHHEIQNYVKIEVPVTAEMTEQTIDLSTVGGLDLTSVWGFGVVSYCGEVTLDNLRLEWTTGGTTEEETKTISIYNNGTFGISGWAGGSSTYNKADESADAETNSIPWKITSSWGNARYEFTSANDFSEAGQRNGVLKFNIKSTGWTAIRLFNQGYKADTGAKDGLVWATTAAGISSTGDQWKEVSIALSDFGQTSTSTTWGSTVTASDLDLSAVKGIGFNFDGTIYVDNVRVEWTQSAESTAPVKNVKLNGGVLSLDGKIGVKMYLDIPEDVSREAVVNITAPDATVSSVTVGDGTVTENGIMFYCPVAAKEMTVDIKIQVIDGADASDELTYSVKKYADGLLAGDYSEESKTLIKAMLNYGAMAQKLFDYKTDSLANAGLAASDQDLSAITADTLATYAKEKQSVEGVATLAGTILSLESETTLKLFFSDVAEGATFTYNGAAITPTQSGSYYMVAITNIAAKDLNKDYTVTINGKDFTFSAMSFCENVLKENYTGEKKEELVNVAKALYAYSVAADAYFGE